MDPDLFQRTCKCYPKREDTSVDISEVESNEILGYEETEAIEEREEETVDCEQLQRELECMKRRIQKIQLLLKTKSIDVCPEEPCVDFEVELNCSSNKEICALQKSQHKLQCQIDELVRSSRVAKEQIKEMRYFLCEQAKKVRELEKAVTSLNAWRQAIDREFGVCIERFEYLKTVKAEWDEVYELFETEKLCHAERENKFVPKTCYKHDKVDFKERLDALKELFDNLFINVRRLNDFYHLDVLEETSSKSDDQKDSAPTKWEAANNIGKC